MNLYLLEDLPPLSQDTAVCLGTFDGVHLGHQVLARQTVQAARQEGLIPCAYTFDVPPASVLGAGKEDILTDIQGSDHCPDGYPSKGRAAGRMRHRHGGVQPL